MAVWIATLRQVATLAVAWMSQGPRIEPDLMRNQPFTKPTAKTSASNAEASWHQGIMASWFQGIEA